MVLLLNVGFEEINETVVGIGIADGAKFPAAAMAVDLAQDHGAFPVEMRVRN